MSPTESVNRRVIEVPSARLTVQTYEVSDVPSARVTRAGAEG